MIAVVQRVLSASVTVEGAVGEKTEPVARISSGLLTLLGIEKGDTSQDLSQLMQKIIELRIFADDQGKMNLSVLDVKGEHLLVSQFTLAGDCSRGKRPSFHLAEEPARAKAMFEEAIELSQKLGVSTQAGIFAADMKVELLNDGPVTFVLRSSDKNI